jgi:uroporphyrinogen decarboxylase
MSRLPLAVPFAHPRPDVEEFLAVVRGREPRRAHFTELFLDLAVMKEISERYLDRHWVEPVPGDRASIEAYIRNVVTVWHRMGFDYVWTGLLGGLVFPGKSRSGDDTSALSKGRRVWTDENAGLISSWDDFERYPWPDPAGVPLWPYEFLADALPDGMGMMMCFGQGVLETAMNIVVGYVPLSFMVIDQPDLAAAVFDRIGQIILDMHKRIVGMKKVRGFFPGDDMGFRTGPLLSPGHLRSYVLPWHKKLADLAHGNGLAYFLHSCGDISSIMEDLIDDVRIDARHSFEDVVVPVAEFRKAYRGRLGVLGGVDVGVLCTATEENLRRYARGILDTCMAGGGYAFGSGNSVANYIPVASFMAMMDEGARWQA